MFATLALLGLFVLFVLGFWGALTVSKRLPEHVARPPAGPADV